MTSTVFMEICFWYMLSSEITSRFIKVFAVPMPSESSSCKPWLYIWKLIRFCSALYVCWAEFLPISKAPAATNSASSPLSSPEAEDIPAWRTDTTCTANSYSYILPTSKNESWYMARGVNFSGSISSPLVTKSIIINQLQDILYYYFQ